VTGFIQTWRTIFKQETVSFCVQHIFTSVCMCLLERLCNLNVHVVMCVVLVITCFISSMQQGFYCPPSHCNICSPLLWCCCLLRCCSTSEAETCVVNLPSLHICHPKCFKSKAAVVIETDGNRIMFSVFLWPMNCL